MMNEVRIKESFMREFISFSESESSHYVVRLVKSIDSSPKFEFIDILMRTKKWLLSEFQSQSKWLIELPLVDVQSESEYFQHFLLFFESAKVHFEVIYF